MVQYPDRGQTTTRSAKNYRKYPQFTATPRDTLTVERAFCPNPERQMRALILVLGLPSLQTSRAARGGVA